MHKWLCSRVHTLLPSARLAEVTQSSQAKALGHIMVTIPSIVFCTLWSQIQSNTIAWATTLCRTVKAASCFSPHHSCLYKSSYILVGCFMHPSWVSHGIAHTPNFTCVFGMYIQNHTVVSAMLWLLHVSLRSFICPRNMSARHHLRNVWNLRFDFLGDRSPNLFSV